MEILKLLKEKTFKELLSVCIGKVYANQLALGQYLGNYKRWNVDINEGKLMVDDKEFDVEFIGTTSAHDGMWFSAELEKIIPQEYLNILREVKENLVENGLEEFYFEKIRLDDTYTDHALAIIYTALAKENLCYFKGSGDISLFMYMKGLPETLFKPINSEKFFSLSTIILKNFEVDHRLMLKALAINNHNEIEENESEIIIKFENGNPMIFKFDALNRVVKINFTANKS